MYTYGDLFESPQVHIFYLKCEKTASNHERTILFLALDTVLLSPYPLPPQSNQPTANYYSSTYLSSSVGSLSFLTIFYLRIANIVWPMDEINTVLLLLQNGEGHWEACDLGYRYTDTLSAWTRIIHFLATCKDESTSTSVLNSPAPHTTDIVSCIVGHSYPIDSLMIIADR